MEETSNVSKRYYIYVLLSSKDNKLYIGYTTNLKIRLSKHANVAVTATRYRRPLKLIHYEYFVNETDAKAREVFLKSGSGHTQLKNFMRRTLVEYKYKSL